MSIFSPPFYLGTADGLIILLVIVATAVSTVVFRAKVWNANPIVMGLSLVWHTSFTIAYCALGARGGGDIFLYYERAGREAMEWGDLYGLGTTFIVWVITPLVDGLQIGILPVSIVFGVLGFFGIWLLAAAIVENLEALRWKRGLRFAYVLIFLPGINHWTSALGKDALIMFALGLFIFALSKPRQRWIAVAVGWLLVFHIRPHISIVLILAVTASLILSGRTMSVQRRALAIVTMIVVAFIAFPYVLEFLDIKAGGVGDYISYVEERGELNMRGDSSVDMYDYSLVGRAFAFLFRPLPFEAHNLTSLVASIENILLLLMILTALVKFRLVDALRNGSLLVNFLAFYSIGSTILLSGVTLNLGLAFRQKTMVIVAIIALIAIAASQGKRQVSHEVRKVYV